MVDNIIYKIKDEITNNKLLLIKKTETSNKISKLAWEIIDKEKSKKIIELFHQVIKFVYNKKKIKTTISKFDLFHFHIILNNKKEIELLFHLFEYPKNIGRITNKNSNLYVNMQDFKHRNVIYNCSTKQFRFCYQFFPGKYSTVDASTIGTWIGDVYLDDVDMNKCIIFLLSNFCYNKIHLL